jgi:hypothetical protein
MSVDIIKIGDEYFCDSPLLGIIRQISRTDNQSPLYFPFIAIYENCYKVPTRESRSIHIFMSLARVHALGLSHSCRKVYSLEYLGT